MIPPASDDQRRLIPRGRGRRLFWSVLAGVLLLCGAGVVAVPVVWFAQRTHEAGRGEVSPDASANVYLLQLSAGDEIGVRRVLVGDHRDQLLGQWRAYRAEMDRTSPKPSKLEVGSLAVAKQGRTAVVTVPVRAVWWQGSASMQSPPYEWRFELVDADRWQIKAVTPPKWCGGVVLVSACR